MYPPQHVTQTNFSRDEALGLTERGEKLDGEIRASEVGSIDRGGFSHASSGLQGRNHLDGICSALF